MYQGNKSLRAEHEKIIYTKDLINEYIKCKEDIIYFAEKYFYIVSNDKGKHRIELYGFQKKILKAFISNPKGKKSVILLLPRQSGKTTTSTVYLLHYMIFNKDKNVAILANKEKTATEIMRRIQLAYAMLPIWLQQRIVEGGRNKTSIRLANGMRAISSTTSSDSISGEAISLLYMDEFAKVKNHVAQEFITATMPVVSSSKNSKVIMVSCVTDDTFVNTPNGIKEVSDFINYDMIEHPNIGYEIDEYSVIGKDGVNNGKIMVNSGYVDTKIITSQSSKVECSLRHPWWVCKNGKFDWVRTEDLDGSEYIAIKYGMNKWGNNDVIPKINIDDYQHNVNDYRIDKITKDFAYFIGLYISEGSIQRSKKNINNIFYSGVNITCGDDVSGVLNSLGFKYYCPDGLHYSISSKILCDILISLGFDLNRKAPRKIIPKRLFEMSRDNVVSMLQGIMDGDGSSQINKGTVCIRLSSKRLIEQIRAILNNFGILSTYVNGITPPNELVKVESEYFGIELNKTMSRKYYDMIGFRFKRKQLKEKYLPESIKRDSFDVIPYSKDIITSLKYTHNDDDYKKIVNSGMLKGNYKKNFHFSRMLMLRHKQMLLSLNNPIINNLYENISEDIKWEPISKIIKSKNKVYDFSLNHIDGDKWCHSVSYNNMLGHQTPLGLNHFYDYWSNAVKGENDFFPIKVGWWEHPDRDEEWKERTISLLNGNIIKFNQEFGCKFLGSSNTLIDGDVLERFEYIPPVLTKWNGLFTIFEKPKKDTLYILGIDTGKGTGRDNSVVQVLKIENEKSVEQVAIYKYNRIDTHEFAKVCIGISQYYNNAYMMIENNGEGGETAQTIWFEYENELILNCDKKGIGIRSTKKSKLKANLNLKRYLEHGWLKLNDRDTVVELSKYIEVTPNVFKAETRTTHDDCVTSLIWGMYFLTTHFFDGKDTSVKRIDDEYNLGDDDDSPLILFS